MSSDDLDKQVRAALKTAAPPEQLARLEQFWRAQSRAERRRRTQLAALAVAASVAIAAWVALDRAEPQPAPRRDQVATVEPARDALPRDESPLPAPAGEVATADSAISPESPPASYREPTDYERIMFAARTATPVDREQALLDPEQTLITRFRRARDFDELKSVVNRLAESGSPRSVPVLLDAAEHPELRPLALAAVERIVGIEQLLEVARTAPSAVVRRALLERVLTADSPAALDGFLSLAARPATRGEALAVADSVNQLPIAALVVRLDAKQKNERLAAALVLGHVNGPAVSAALIARVSQPERASVETWVALLACRGDAVDQFLVQAMHRPQMLGQVNNARAYWARMMP